MGNLYKHKEVEQLNPSNIGRLAIKRYVSNSIIHLISLLDPIDQQDVYEKVSSYLGKSIYKNRIFSLSFQDLDKLSKVFPTMAKKYKNIQTMSLSTVEQNRIMEAELFKDVNILNRIAELLAMGGWRERDLSAHLLADFLFDNYYDVPKADATYVLCRLALRSDIQKVIVLAEINSNRQRRIALDLIKVLEFKLQFINKLQNYCVYIDCISTLAHYQKLLWKDMTKPISEIAQK